MKGFLHNLAVSRLSTLLILMLAVGTGRQVYAQNEFPVVYAIDPGTGFLMDSSESQQHNYFPAIPREQLNYMILTGQFAHTYKVTAVYIDGNLSSQWYDEEEVRKEREKVTTGKSDSLIIPDYSAAKNLVKDAKGFYYFDNNFSRKLYDPYGKVKERNDKPFVFGTFGSGLSIIEGDRFLLSPLTLGLNVYYKKLFFATEWQAGRSQFFVSYYFNEDRYSLRDVNFRTGVVLVNQEIFAALSAGYSFNRLKVGTKIYDMYGDVSGYTYMDYYGGGIPVALDISFPPSQNIGLHVRLKSNFIFEHKTAFTLTIGMRVGKVQPKIKPELLQ